MKPLTHDITLTEFDQRRLRGLLHVFRQRSGVDAWNLDALATELDRAKVVPAEQLPANVVTMNSRVCLVDVDSGQRTPVALVFPYRRDADATHVPVLSPLGLALLGCRAGDVIAWETAAGVRRLRVDSVLYQPEAAGHHFV